MTKQTQKKVIKLSFLR